LNYELDDESQRVLSYWNLQCGTYTTTSFSTPTLYTPTSTYFLPSNTQLCDSI
jgi:hypothetical protein